MLGITSFILLLVLQAYLVQSQIEFDNAIPVKIYNSMSEQQFPAVTAICFPNASAAQLEELALNMCNANMTEESLQGQCQVTRYPIDGILVDVNSSASEPRLQYCFWYHPDNISCSEDDLICENCTETEVKNMVPCIRQSCLHCEWTIQVISDAKMVVTMFNKTATSNVQLDLEISWDNSGRWDILQTVSNVSEQIVLRFATKEMKLSYNASSFIQDPSVIFITVVLLQSDRKFLSKRDLYNGSAIAIICLLVAALLCSCICCHKHRRQKEMSVPQTYKLTYRSEVSAFSEEEKYAMLTRASKDLRRERTSSASDNSKNQQETEVSHRTSMFLLNILSCLSPKRTSYSTVVNPVSEAPVYNELDDASIQELLKKFDSLILTFERSNNSTDSSFSDEGDKFPVTLIELVDGKCFCSEQLFTNDGNSPEASDTKSSEEMYSCMSSDESVHSFFSVHPQNYNSDMDSFTSLSYEADSNDANI